MDKSLYRALAALYKEYEPRVRALSDEIKERLAEMGLRDRVIPFISFSDWVQLYVDKPSEGAKFTFEDDEDDGTKFYETAYDGVRFVEMVEKND